jgi:hypothetical protein
VFLFVGLLVRALMRLARFRAAADQTTILFITATLEALSGALMGAGAMSFWCAAFLWWTGFPEFD